MSAPSIAPGATVRYYQPTADEILASWAGDRRGPERGEIRETTVVAVSDDGYITTADGTILSAEDLR